MLTEVERLRAENAALRSRLRSRHCGCAWCCATTPPEDRGETHKRTCQQKPAAVLGAAADETTGGESS